MNHRFSVRNRLPVLIFCALLAAGCFIPACAEEIPPAGGCDARPGQGHQFMEEIGTPASCTQEGVKRRICSLCGYTEENVSIPKESHDYAKKAVDQEAACTSSGSYHMVCTGCGMAESSPGGDVLSYTIPALGHEKLEGWAANGTAHWHTCSRCDSQLDFGQHDAQNDQDCTTLDQCSVCGYVVSAASEGHKITFSTNENYHWTSCQNPGCNYKVLMTAHAFYAVDGNCTKGMTCAVCGYQTLKHGLSHAADPMRGWQIDGSVHYLACINPGCNGRAAESAHSGEDDGNCETPVLCYACGALMTPAKTHDFGPWLYQDEETEERVCRSVGCTWREARAHGTETREAVIVPASCTAPGRKTVTKWCAGCQSVISKAEAEITAAGHDWGKWEPLGAAGCNNAGAEQRVCRRCKSAEMRNLNPEGHDWETEYTVDQAPACTEDGSQSIHCKNCSATKASVSIPQLGHDHSRLVETVRAASCQDDRMDRVGCARCEDTVIRTEPGTALGHDFRNYQPNRDASCLAGETETALCARCGAADTRRREGSQPLGHLYQSDYDCTTADPCVRCGALGEGQDAHTPSGQWLIDAGFGTHYRLCANPGCSQHVLEAPHQKAPDDGDCTTAVRCAVCGTVMELGNAYHEYGPWMAEEDGHSRACQKAGCAAKQTEAHVPSFSDSNVDVMPDCTHAGHSTSRIYCEVCGGVYASENAELPPLGHVFSAYDKSGDASCEENAAETARCTRCGAADTREIPDSALGHDFGEYDGNNDASCEKNGTETAVCARCGAADTREVPHSALGHLMSAYGDDENAACEKNGTETARCVRCGWASIRTVSGSALGHSYGLWQPSGDGAHSISCARCGHTASEPCAYSEITVQESLVQVCPVCGDMIGPSGRVASAPRFELIDARVEESAPGAIPQGAELVVRMLETPFPEVLEAFTVCCEEGGLAVPLQGAVVIRLPLALESSFRLVRVDADPDEAGQIAGALIDMSFTYENSALTFETDRDGLFLLPPEEAE